MNTEAIKAAQTLLESKIIDQDQFAKLVITALNGHAATAQMQLPVTTAQRKPHHSHYLTVQQATDLMEMHLMGVPPHVIADTLTQRYQFIGGYTAAAVKQWIRETRNGLKASFARYQTPEWKAFFERFQKAI